MDVVKIFESKAVQLFWESMDASRVVGVPPPRVIEPGQAYFVVRLCEMYLGDARKLWRQIYPMLHCYTQFGTTNDHAVVSPVEFEALGDANLNRIVNLNMRLSGPNPFHGEEVSILAGLYAVPGHDSAKALIDIVSSLAALDPTPIGQSVALSGLIKNGVETILSLDQASLHLGIRDTLNSQSKPLTTGYFAGIGAPGQSVDVSQLWVVDGRLHKGKDAATAVPYTDHDYMLVAIERMDTRDDWQQLPELQDYLGKFANLIADSQYTVAEKQSRLAAFWPGFVQALANSVHLTDPDRERIAAFTAAGLWKKLKVQDELNPFLRKAA